MPQNENDLPDTEERPSIGEVIREWAVPAAAIVIIVLGIGYGVISIVRMEIRATEHTVSSFESRFEKADEQLVRANAKTSARFENVDEQLARSDAKSDERFERVDDRIDRLETKVDLNARKLKQLVESVNRMNRKMDAHLTLHNRKNDTQPNASLFDPDGEAPMKPL